LLVELSHVRCILLNLRTVLGCRFFGHCRGSQKMAVTNSAIKAVRFILNLL
jgi:hypothetical protein